jgi:hypothetical protein
MESRQRGSFEKMIMPKAANMPPAELTPIEGGDFYFVDAAD